MHIQIHFLFKNLVILIRKYFFTEGYGRNVFEALRTTDQICDGYCDTASPQFPLIGIVSKIDLLLFFFHQILRWCIL